MATKSVLVSVHVIVEMDADGLDEKNRRLGVIGNHIGDIVIAAVRESLADRPHTTLESHGFTCLDSFPHCGRCAECNRWVYDAEAAVTDFVTGLCRGAFVEGRYLCDEHLPKDHPIAF